MDFSTITKKTGAVMLLCSLFLSLCGCSAFSKKPVMAAAKEIAENIESFDADKLLDLSTLNKHGEKAEDLRKGLNGEYLDENTKKFCDAVRSTFTYEIREKSFKVEGKEASIDIDFTFADYDKILKNEYKTIDELVSAVKNTDDMITVTYTAKFIKEDNEWLLDNLMSSGFLKLFEFMDADIGVLAVDLSKIVDTSKKCEWVGETDGIYKNAKKISLIIYFTDDITKLKGKGFKATYTVEKDGKSVWTSDPFELGDKTSVQLDYGKDLDPNAEVKSNYLAKGAYKITLTAENGTVLFTAYTQTDVTVTETTSGSSTISKGYKIYDNAFASKVMRAEWVNVDNKRVNAASYGSDATRVSFQIQVDPSCTDKIYAAYFYAANLTEAAKIKVRTDTPMASGTQAPITNSNGSFYALGLRSKTTASLTPGIYILAIFSEDRQTILALADCQILSMPASSYN